MHYNLLNCIEILKKKVIRKCSYLFEQSYLIYFGYIFTLSFEFCNQELHFK